MSISGLLKLNNQGHQGEDNRVDEKQNDFAVILNGNRTFLLKQKIAKKINYFNQYIMHTSSQICFINQKINAKIFQKVLKCFQTYECPFERNFQAIQLMQVLIFLKIQKLRKLLIKDFLDNFDSYGFFILFQISQKFNIIPVKQKCIYQLLNLQFQQLNFNRYDLMHCSPEIFEHIVKLHQYYVKKMIVKGLKQKNIKKIINNYCEFNNVKLDTQKILTAELNFSADISESQRMISSQQKAHWRRFRTPSFDLSDLAQSIDFIEVNEMKSDVPTLKILKKKSEIIYIIENCFQFDSNSQTLDQQTIQNAAEQPNKNQNFLKTANLADGQGPNKKQTTEVQDAAGNLKKSTKSLYSNYSIAPSTSDTI